MNRIEQKKIYYDVRTCTEGDLIRILAENRLAELHKRVSPYELIFDKDGFPMQRESNGELKKMGLDMSNKLSLLEIEGMQGIRELSLNGYKTIVWFSPNGGNSPYVENRMTVASLKEKKVDGSMIFDCRGICSKHERKDFFDRIKQIISDKDNYIGREISDPDELRNHPVGLVLGEEKWFDYMAKFFDDIPEVFKAIAEGEDIRNMLKMTKIAEDVRREFGTRMVGVDNYYDAVRLGALIERFIERNHGISLMAGGSHGASNNSVESAFNTVFDESVVVTPDTPGSKLCPECKCYYLGDACPCGYTSKDTRAVA